MDDLVIATMATYPPRYNMALAAIQHVAPQVDRLHVYVNDYHEGRHHPPPWLNRVRSNVRVTVGSEAVGSISDVGKFYATHLLPPCFHLTLDDDIQYPTDYVKYLVRGIERYERRYVCGFHGCNINGAADSYYRGGQVGKAHFAQNEPTDRPVHLLGTGVLGYHTEALRLRASVFKAQHMADIYLALHCQRHKVGMVSLEKPAGWINARATPEPGIYERFKHHDVAQTSAISQQPHWTHYAVT